MTMTFETTHMRAATRSALACMKWDDIFNLKCESSGRVSYSVGENEQRSGISGGIQWEWAAVRVTELHILAGIYFALGGFLDTVTCCTWVVIVEGVGILSLTFAYIHIQCRLCLYSACLRSITPLNGPLLVLQRSTPPARCIAPCK